MKLRDHRLGLLWNTRDALFAVDRDQCIIHWNKGAEKLLGYSEPDVLGKSCWRVIGGRRGNRTWCQPNCRIHRCVLREIHPPHHYFETRTKQGRPIWVSVSTLTLKVKHQPVVLHLLTSVPRGKLLQQTLVKLQGSQQVHGTNGSGRTRSNAISLVKAPTFRKATDAGHLTRREIEVLQLLAEGLSTHGIANRAGISFFTARNHIQNGLRKIGVQNRAQAVSFVYSSNLL
jgi:PAS domain S-box-containing protein